MPLYLHMTKNMCSKRFVPPSIHGVGVSEPISGPSYASGTIQTFQDFLFTFYKCCRFFPCCFSVLAHLSG